MNTSEIATVEQVYQLAEQVERLATSVGRLLNWTEKIEERLFVCEVKLKEMVQ